jgi:hypothetical protein
LYPNAEDLGNDTAKLVPEYSVVVGKLPIKNDKIYILYGIIGDIIYPYLNIYDKNGKQIDSLYLHIGNCAEIYDDNYEMEINIINATTINKDFSIHMIDSTKFHYDVEDNLNNIADTVIVKTRKMNLTKDGYYKITKETTQQITQ